MDRQQTYTGSDFYVGWMRGPLVYRDSLSRSRSRSPLYCNGATHKPKRDTEEWIGQKYTI